MSEWEPATEAESAMREALRADDQEHYFRILGRTELLLPVSSDALAGRVPMGWGTWNSDGRTHVLAFTSPEALRSCLAEHAGSYRRLPFHELAAGWPNLEWWLAVNPGLPIEAYLPAWFVAQVSRGDVRLPGRTLGARARVEQTATIRARAAVQAPSRAAGPADERARADLTGPGRLGARTELTGARRLDARADPAGSRRTDEPSDPSAPGRLDGRPAGSGRPASEPRPFLDRGPGVNPEPAPSPDRRASPAAPPGPGARSDAGDGPGTDRPGLGERLGTHRSDLVSRSDHGARPGLTARPGPLDSGQRAGAETGQRSTPPGPGTAPVSPARPAMGRASALAGTRLADALVGRSVAQGRRAQPATGANAPVSGAPVSGLPASRAAAPATPAYPAAGSTAPVSPVPVSTPPVSPASPLPTSPAPAASRSPMPDPAASRSSMPDPAGRPPAASNPSALSAAPLSPGLPAAPRSPAAPATPEPAAGHWLTGSWRRTEAVTPAGLGTAASGPTSRPVASAATGGLLTSAAPGRGSAEPAVTGRVGPAVPGTAQRAAGPTEPASTGAGSPARSGLNSLTPVVPALPTSPAPLPPAPDVKAVGDSDGAGQPATGRPAVDPELAAFTPANRVEEGLVAAVTQGSTDSFLSTLLLAKVLVPGPPGCDDPLADIDRLRTEEIDGAPYLVVFTSPRLLAQRLGDDAHAGWVRFTQLIRAWPDEALSFAVNPGTPIGANMPGAQIVALASWATDVGLTDEHPEPEPEPPAAEPAESVTAPPPPPAGRHVIMQKAVPAAQLPFYLERGYDRVSGFVHRASEVAHLGTPAQMYQALGLGWSGSPFTPDDPEMYVLRWAAHRGDLYRIPYGGQHESAMRAMQGWVIERAPFRGNGFAPSDSRDVIAEFKVDSARLPHGAQLWRIDRDGGQALVATFDADNTRWQRVDAE